MFGSIQDIYTMLANQAVRKKVVLAAAEDVYALQAVEQATRRGFIDPVLVGDEQIITRLCQKNSLDLSTAEIIHEPNQLSAVEKAVQIVSSHHGDVLMKGASSTSVLLKAVLNKEWGLRQGALLSHLALFELPEYHKLLAISDVAINISPGVPEKIEIVKNAVGYLEKIGIDNPKVAMIAAVEKVYSTMPATVEAEQVVQAVNQDESIRCIIGGPFALDNAINKQSARHKGIESEVAGDADLLIMPQIESGNVLYKALAAFAKPVIAAVVVGAGAPIVLTSRADSETTKLNSIVLGAASN